MKEKDVIQLLQYYRHDLMNDLQVIQGYLSMDKIDMVKAKMDDFIEHFNEERKLLRMNAPRFVLWVLQLNHHQENIQLTYQINSEELNLVAIDELLLEHCEQITEEISALGSRNELYDIHLQINKQADGEVLLQIAIDGQFERKSEVLKRFESLKQNSQIDIRETEHGLICAFLYPME